MPIYVAILLCHYLNYRRLCDFHRARAAAGHGFSQMLTGGRICRLVRTGVLDLEPMFLVTDENPVQVDDSFI